MMYVIIFRIHKTHHQLFCSLLESFSYFQSSTTSPITCQDFSISLGLAPQSPAHTIKAFQRPQPLALSQLSSSTFRCFRNVSLLSLSNKVQAITKSQDGSPIPVDPKSMTALKLPFLTSKLP